MKQNVKKIREEYIKHPPKGISAKEIRNMSDEELMDMHYFLDDEEFDDGAW